LPQTAQRQQPDAELSRRGHRRERYTALPFFWSQHYDVSIDDVDHAQTRDQIDQDGDIAAADVALWFCKAGPHAGGPDDLPRPGKRVGGARDGTA
jgi:hypothetical protein